jgi:hypothetical protein
LWAGGREHRLNHSEGGAHLVRRSKTASFVRLNGFVKEVRELASEAQFRPDVPRIVRVALARQAPRVRVAMRHKFVEDASESE